MNVMASSVENTSGIFKYIRPALQLHEGNVKIYVDSGSIQDGDIIGASIYDGEMLVTNTELTSPKARKVLLLGGVGCSEVESSELLTTTTTSISEHTISKYRSMGYRDLEVSTMPHAIDRLFGTGAWTVVKNLSVYEELTVQQREVLDQYKRGARESAILESLEISLTQLTNKRNGIVRKSRLGSIAGAVLIDHMKHDEPRQPVPEGYITAVVDADLQKRYGPSVPPKPHLKATRLVWPAAYTS